MAVVVTRMRTLLAVGNSHNENWPLANIQQGSKFELLANDVEKRVAAYLLVSGFVLGEFSVETLKQASRLAGAL